MTSIIAQIITCVFMLFAIIFFISIFNPRIKLTAQETLTAGILTIVFLFASYGASLLA